MCNICGNQGKLTEDHTPPKSCLRPKAVELRHATAALNAEELAAGARRVLQDGVRYRTLCARCNNQLLGLVYDPAFAKFCNSVSAVITSQLQLPLTVPIRAFPQRIARAIFGHIAAQGVNRYPKGPLTEAMRDWFQDESAMLPAPVRFMYWLYPFPGQVLARDYMVMDLPTGVGSLTWLMKFFPMAFAMLWEGSFPPLAPRDLNRFLHLPADQEVEIPLDLAPIADPMWLQAPTESMIIAMGQEAAIATEKRERRPRS